MNWLLATYHQRLLKINYKQCHGETNSIIRQTFVQMCLVLVIAVIVCCLRFKLIFIYSESSRGNHFKEPSPLRARTQSARRLYNVKAINTFRY